MTQREQARLDALTELVVEMRSDVKHVRDVQETIAEREIPEIKRQVKATNGRVTALELENARAEGRAEGASPFKMLAFTVAGGSVSAVVGALAYVGLTGG